ncbi:UNVERIFIED_CONTAM: hypothetical protein FKN15_023607 [Acipenser sinensis]
MNTRCPPKRVPSAARFFTICRLTVQPPQSYSVGGQRSFGQLTGKPAGARPDYRVRWCATADTKPGLQGEASPDLQRTTSTSTESTAPAPEHPVRNRVGSELLFRDCNPLVLLLVIPIAG